MTAAEDPRAVTRRVTAKASRRVHAAVQAMRDNRAARRAAVAAVPVLGVLTVAVVVSRRLSARSLRPDCVISPLCAAPTAD